MTLPRPLARAAAPLALVAALCGCSALGLGRPSPTPSALPDVTETFLAPPTPTPTPTAAVSAPARVGSGTIILQLVDVHGAKLALNLVYVYASDADNTFLVSSYTDAKGRATIRSVPAGTRMEIGTILDRHSKYGNASKDIAAIAAGSVVKQTLVMVKDPAAAATPSG
ncbi:hypothetical protein [Galbitalea soli]|uniref:Carboxypeptidase regulatory-like domain-containing protein n=1 Tax=Galbitalea soli TaxID=1268042 RepID=A0A7C9PN14_9MICO|nr:hypothetical protein [Galbitalea soli]NEM91312.1 hypothetical protein [Galbitalea soli]NYJ30001.1 hypothetical protein [Galbitalea soli]